MVLQNHASNPATFQHQQIIGLDRFLVIQRWGKKENCPEQMRMLGQIA
jgi:hypothetical protein